MAMPSTWCAIAAVRVAGHDDVDQPARQPAGDGQDLGVRIAGRQVVGAIDRGAASAGVGGDDDDVGALRPQRGRMRPDGVGQRRHRQPADVAGDGRGQGLQRHHADDADLEAGHVDQRGRPHVGPAGRRAAGGLDQVRGEEREARLRRPRPQRATGIVGRRPRRRRLADRAEVELVIADRRGRVAEGVVGRHDGRPFADVRFERALEHVAGVDQEHRAAVTRPGRAQVLHVAAEQRETAAAVPRHHAAVQVVGADDRHRDGRRGCGRRSRRRRDGRRAAGREQQAARGEHAHREERDVGHAGLQGTTVETWHERTDQRPAGIRPRPTGRARGARRGRRDWRARRSRATGSRSRCSRSGPP